MLVHQMKRNNDAILLSLSFLSRASGSRLVIEQAMRRKANKTKKLRKRNEYKTLGSSTRTRKRHERQRNIISFDGLKEIQMQQTAMRMKPTVLIVGATGATGKHLVQSLLDESFPVSVIVRSKERLLSLINNNNETLLTITETPSFRDLSDDDYHKLVEKADFIVSCLGHNMNVSGIWGRTDRRLVTDTVKRLTAKGTKKKFILMSSDGVVGPNDDRRPFSERAILSAFRYMVTPHVDNEEAAAYLQNNFAPDGDAIEWIIVRPTDLTDDDLLTNVSGYEVHDKPIGGLFGGAKVSRSLVAKFMKDLICAEQLWRRYAYQMPVLHNAKTQDATSKEEE